MSVEWLNAVHTNTLITIVQNVSGYRACRLYIKVNYCILLIWHSVHVDLANPPFLVQLGEVDNHVFTVVAVTVTRCLASGQSTGHDCFTPLTHGELSSECTAGPLRRSHPDLEVERGAREVVSGDCEGERRLHSIRHTSLDDQSGHPAVLPWMWEPVTVARVKLVAGSFC